MKSNTLLPKYYRLNLLFLVILIAGITAYYFGNSYYQSEELKISIKEEFRGTIEHIKYYIRSEKEKFQLSISDPSKGQMTYLKDYYTLSPDGKIVKLYKSDSQFVYFPEHDIGGGEFFKDIARFKENVTGYYGPFFSVLTKEMTIALVYKSPKVYHIAHLDISKIADIKINQMSGIPGALIFTSREGLILIDAQKLYPFGNITMHEGVIDIGNARYYHALDYIPEINLYCHSLTPFQRWNDNKENYSFLFHIFLILITIIYTARIFISKVIFIDPVFRLMDDVVKIDIRKKIAFPDPSFHEFTVIREKLSELYQGIRSEISIEKNLKDYYDSIINSSPNLILTTDMNENIVMINQTAVHFFGKGAAQDTKMILDDFFTLSEDERLQFERNKKLTGKTTTILGKKIPKDHKLQVFDVLIYNLTADEEIIGFAFVLIDVTRQSLMEEQLLQTQKMETVGILAGGFAHDFNNLLTIIIGNLDIYRYAKDEAKRAEQIDSVYNASLKASELVKQILNFSRKEDIQVESVIAEDVLMSVVKVVKNSLPKHIKILNNILTESTFVTADAGQLIQACLNIALNARDAIPPERMGKIEISTGIVARRSRELPLLNLDENREYIKISISDNGQGIPDDIRDKIFDPFFSTKERDSIKGRGLGLSVVYGTIQRFHGAIDFESFKDKGTVFNIYLPVSEREPKAAEEPPIPAPAKKLNLLVVDDDANIRKLGQKFLNLLGYESKTAVNGKKAEIVLKENRFDIIILDLIMPEFDGIYFLEHLKKNNIEIPVIITTGHFDEFSRTELGKYTNVKGFIDKPFTLMQFSQAVRDTAKLIP